MESAERSSMPAAWQRYLRRSVADGSGRGRLEPQQMPPGKTVLGVACADIERLGIHKQVNRRAGRIRIGCGLEPGGAPVASPAPLAAPMAAPAPALPGNFNVITGAETSPHVTQSGSMVWSSDGKTIVVNYNDSRDVEAAGTSGLSVSTDGGSSWVRFDPSPLNSGHGSNFGDPILVFNQKLATWFAGDLAAGAAAKASGCGVPETPSPGPQEPVRIPGRVTTASRCGSTIPRPARSMAASIFPGTTTLWATGLFR